MTYKVGKGQPPRKTRFHSGQSGNPKGRPKGSKNLATILNRELEKKVTIREGDKTRRASKAEAVVISTINKSLSGDAKATNTVLALQSRAGMDSGDERTAGTVPDDELEFLALHLPRFLKMIQQGRVGRNDK